MLWMHVQLRMSSSKVNGEISAHSHLSPPARGIPFCILPMLDGHSELLEGHLNSSQAFVRALKATSDPPAQDGPSKLEIACAGWEREEFLVFNKEELICDWLIGKLVKDRSQPQ